MGAKRTQTCPLCKKTMNVRSLKKSDTMNDVVSRAKQLEKKFHTEFTSSFKSIQTNNEKTQLVEVPTKRKRNSSIVSLFFMLMLKHLMLNKMFKDSANVNNLKKIKSAQESAKTNNLIDEIIVNSEEGAIKTKKVEEWLEKNGNISSSKVNFDNDNDKIRYIEPLADSTNKITQEKPVKNAKSPLNVKKIPNIILDTCLDSVDSTCSTNSKNLVIHEPDSNLDAPGMINKNNNEPLAQPAINNENEPEKLLESNI
jgi:hypothetical protein